MMGAMISFLLDIIILISIKCSTRGYILLWLYKLNIFILIKYTRKMSTAKISDLVYEDFTSPYGQACVAVYGDTKKHKDNLKQLGGRYNPNLAKGVGWVFTKPQESILIDYINTGIVKNGVTTSSSSSSYIHSTQPTLSEFATMITLLNKMSAKIDSLEMAITLIMTPAQKKTLKMMTDNSNTECKTKPKVIVTADSDIEEDSNSDDSDDEIKPVKRLMAKTKR